MFSEDGGVGGVVALTVGARGEDFIGVIPMDRTRGQARSRRGRTVGISDKWLKGRDVPVIR
jgi:hypothetical protein